MNNLYMYLCDICGFSKEKPGLCPHCEVVLTEYTKETQREYDLDMEEAMRTMSPMKWYL